MSLLFVVPIIPRTFEVGLHGAAVRRHIKDLKRPKLRIFVFSTLSVFVTALVTAVHVPLLSVQ